VKIASIDAGDGPTLGVRDDDGLVIDLRHLGSDVRPICGPCSISAIRRSPDRGEKRDDHRAAHPAASASVR